MNKKIGILGCGWLGLPLAKQLIRNGHSVFGSTTSHQKLGLLQNEGIAAFKISLSPNSIQGDINGFLSKIDILIINVPPRLRGKHTESFVDKMKLLHLEIKKSRVSKVLFISSTSVYGPVTGEVTEETHPMPTSESGIQLYESEQLFKEGPAFRTTIIRFGGLIGPTRHPVTMLSQRKNLSNGDDPVNLIHLYDCIHMINTIIDNDYWDELFNGVYPLHPKKREYYSQEAAKRNIAPPLYSVKTEESLGKIVVCKNFMNKSHRFITPITS